MKKRIVYDVVVLRSAAGKNANCLIITVPKKILQRAGFQLRDQLILCAKDGQILISRPGA